MIMLPSGSLLPVEFCASGENKVTAPSIRNIPSSLSTPFKLTMEASARYISHFSPNGTATPDPNGTQTVLGTTRPRKEFLKKGAVQSRHSGFVKASALYFLRLPPAIEDCPSTRTVGSILARIVNARRDFCILLSPRFGGITASASKTTLSFVNDAPLSSKEVADRSSLVKPCCCCCCCCCDPPPKLDEDLGVAPGAAKALEDFPVTPVPVSFDGNKGTALAPP